MKTAKNSGVASDSPDGNAERPRIVGERIILGIDPGTTVMGFGVIRAEGPRLTLIAADAIRFDPLHDHTLKLREIFRRTTALIDLHLPDELAIEAQFFGKNVQSMLKLGRAQGVAIAAAIQREVAVSEYAPTRIKQSITGYGGATKEQVAAILLTLLGLRELPRSTDATDAIAVAVCHHFSGGTLTRPSSPKTKGSSTWSSFVKNNPRRVK
ncbi:MAG: crossover junction endodeoxyribonuclease RuvC [Flavobacteriales bacterium]|nr:crossover junction endodeoxyribonuclease RuvC [Flavobacteriales bacterium]